MKNAIYWESIVRREKYLKAGNENVKLLKKSSGWRMKRGRDEEKREKRVALYKD